MLKSRQRNDLAIYDDYAAQWWTGDVRWVRTLRNMVPARLRYFDRFVSWSGKDVLDLGCAGGFMAEALHDRGARVWAIDPSEKAIAIAHAHATETHRDIAYSVGVGEALPYQSRRFDHVVCVDVLEHVADLEQVLREVARVLRPGGWFLFDTINRTVLARVAVVTLAENVLRLLPQGAHDPDKLIRPKDLTQNLHALGFEATSLRGLGPRGLTRRGDITFGALPSTAVQYMGAAQLRSDR